jgi:AcrR family transcriptional regulator
VAEQRLTDHQQAIAERNVTAILDATEELLAQRGQATISAVAKHSGVSRVTVYAHFPTSEALLEAAVERAVGQTMTVLQAAHLGEGPPAEALERLLAAAWRHLARYSAMAQAVAEQMTPEAVARTHRAAHHTLGALLERGRADGSFRSDLPVGWLVTTCIAVIHACAGEVREGRIEERDAARILTTTIRDLFTGRGQVPSGNA